MGAIQFLPACRMFLAMCPEGAEGSSHLVWTRHIINTTIAFIQSFDKSVSQRVSE